MLRFVGVAGAARARKVFPCVVGSVFVHVVNLHCVRERLSTIRAQAKLAHASQIFVLPG
tara:strand:+ start:803 stop:979 length:177 start_codon:yes stop_codon:yes gene_type:complete